MRKRRKFVQTAAAALIVVCLMGMTACGQKPTKQASSPNAGETAGKAQKSAADIFAKSMEASAKLESFSVSMNTKQSFDQAGNKTDIQSKIDMDVIMKPQMSFKQSVTMNSAGKDVKIEEYLTKDGLYMKDLSSGQWMKIPKEQMDTIMSSISKKQLDPSKQFEKLKQFANDFTLTENSDEYTIKLTANGDKFKEFLKNELKSAMGDNPGMEQLLQSTSAAKITALDYTFVIDKKTQLMKSLNMNLELEMDVQGQKISMVQHLEGSYANYNGVKPFELPKEALDAKTPDTP